MAQLSRAAHSWCVRQDALRRVAGSSPATSSSRGVPLHRCRLLQVYRRRLLLSDGWDEALFWLFHAFCLF